MQVKIAGQDMGVVELPGSRDKTVTTKLKITAPRGDQKITFTLINPKSIDIKEKNRKAVRSAVIENIEVEGPIGVRLRRRRQDIAGSLSPSPARAA